MSCFDSLPDICILEIFNRLDLIDIIRCSYVCQRWYMIHEVACEKVVNLRLRRRKDLKHFDHKMLRFFDLDEAKFDFVVDKPLLIDWQHMFMKFPKVQRFAIYDFPNNQNIFDKICQSIRKDKLVEFKMINSKTVQSIISYGEVFKSMGSLKNLSLSNCKLNDISTPEDLDELFIMVDDFSEHLTLERLPNYKKLGIMFGLQDEDIMMEKYDENIRAFKVLKKKKNGTLTRYVDFFDSLSMPYLRSLVKVFPSLTYIDIQVECTNLFSSSIWGLMARLPSLTHLYLKADENFREDYMRSEISNLFNISFPSVRHLDLNNCSSLHPHQYSNLHLLFPNCELMRVQFLPKVHLEKDPRCKKMQLCYYCYNCQQLRTILPSKSDSHFYDKILVHLTLVAGRVDKINLTYEPLMENYNARGLFLL